MCSFLPNIVKKCVYDSESKEAEEYEYSQIPLRSPIDQRGNAVAHAQRVKHLLSPLLDALQHLLLLVQLQQHACTLSLYFISILLCLVHAVLLLGQLVKYSSVSLCTITSIRVYLLLMILGPARHPWFSSSDFYSLSQVPSVIFQSFCVVPIFF